MSTKSRYADNIRRKSVHSAYRDSQSRLNETDGKLLSQHELDKHDDGHVKVAVRCRPMSEKELAAGYESIVDFESEKKIVVHDVSDTPSDQLGTKSGERRNISHVYDFDYVFNCMCSQQEVYERVCRPIVDGVLEGYNGTIFAYGQTGTGKTYTMEGIGQPYRRRSSSRSHSSKQGDNSGNRRGSKQSAEFAAAAVAATRRRSSSTARKNRENSPQPVAAKDQAGIIPRTFEQIFDHVARHSRTQFLIRASYLEIYQEEIRDLLKKDRSIKLELHERQDIGVYVKDLTSFVCKSIGELERVMRVGNQNRMVGATDMNEHSSRSHAIFMITIEQQAALSGVGPKSEVVSESGNSVSFRASKSHENCVIRVGKLNLVDLAGSERQRKTNSSGQRQKESIKINLSLSALGNVINSLMKVQQQRQQSQTTASNNEGSNINRNNSIGLASANALAPIHTPYRDSKLTRLLQDSLGGNAKTLMIANIGPASYNYDETINTLNYASRARCIKNRPKLNEDPKDALLRQLRQEIDLLRAKLATIKQEPVSISKAQLAGGNEQRIAAQTSYSEQSSGVSSAKSSRGSANSTSSTHGAGGQKLPGRELSDLRQKLSSLEDKLLNGDKSSSAAMQKTKIGSLDTNLLKGLTREQELELERRQNELADQAARERAIRDELERREEAEMLAKQSFSSIHQEVDSKRRLIRQLLLKVKSLRDEIEASQAAYRIELDELDQLQCALRRELKLKCLIMDNFVPNGHVDQLLSRITFDERRNLCFIEPLGLATSECCQLVMGADAAENGATLRFEDFWRPTHNSIRPKSEFERISEAIYPSNIRYKYEHLIEPHLEFDEKAGKVRNLSDKLRAEGIAPVECPADSKMPLIQDLLIKALNQREADIVI